MSCKIVCTGWYSDTCDRNYRTFGSDKIRSVKFRQLWLESINRFINPDMIFVVNSKSPILPEPSYFIKEEWCNLDINPGHPQNTSYKFSGWTASVLIGLEYILFSDADYFLYIEQDCLVYGEELIKITEDCLNLSPYVFGHSDNSTQPLQQSLFAIRKDFISEFISNLHYINYSDRVVGPEEKFLLACSGRNHIKIDKLFNSIHFSLGWRYRKKLSRMKPINTFSFGYGRNRPINFNDKVFYFQHGTENEIDQFRQLL